MVDFTGIRTWLVGVEGEHSYHLTITTTHQSLSTRKNNHIKELYNIPILPSQLQLFNVFKPLQEDTIELIVQRVNVFMGRWFWVLQRKLDNLLDL